MGIKPGEAGMGKPWWRALTLRIPRPASPLTPALICLLLWLPVSLWASADCTTSWVATGYLLFGLTLYVALVNWPPAQRRPLLAAWLLLLVGGGLAVVSPPLVAWKPQFRLFYLPLYDRLQALPVHVGETIHANVLAGVLVIVLPLFVTLAFQKDRWQILYAIMAVVVLAMIVLSQSRGGYLAVAVALPLIFVLRWPRLFYPVPALLIGAVVVVYQIGWQNLLDQLSNDGSLDGWAGRIDIWTQSLNALHDFAFTGIGIGTFTLVLPLLYPLQFGIESYPHAHNLLLQIGVDLGLPGLVAYLALLINLIVMLIVVLRRRNLQPGHRALAIGAAGGLTAMLVHGTLDAVVWDTKLSVVPWLLFALITLLFLQERDARIA